MTEPPPGQRTLIVDAEDAGTRLDSYLARHVPGLSRAGAHRLIQDAHVTLAGRPATPATRLQPGDRIAVRVPPTDEAGPAANLDLPLAVVHADAALVVVDKPAGQVVHPAAGHTHDTLVNALLGRFPDLALAFADDPRPGIVHRLDRDTSGVMVVARTPAAAADLKRQFKARTVDKVYLALVRGRVSRPTGIIDAPVGRDPLRRKRMAATPTGRPSRTAFRVLAASGNHSWVEIRPTTGRTHQIRVHFAAIGHAVAGDRVYGRRDRFIDRPALHARALAFDHPASGERVEFEAPLPADMAGALTALGIEFGPADA